MKEAQETVFLLVLEDLLAGDRQQFSHLLANTGVRAINACFVEILANLAEHVLIAGFFQVRQDNRFRIGFGVSPTQPHQIRSPDAKQLVAARHHFELGFLIQCVACLFCALAIIKCAHEMAFLKGGLLLGAYRG